ncbi:uncharacterized protein BDR25DRAFT_26002 [Lindgomyces ingoldianus]|uniref:Uncharacterized protein n=1 Tax=Lindgomyces ingoldianus TaxID=673940 RepID=A0ACB6QXT7_9PLEO|nr:uncharacterized protein BDR25DRAFT_26002 [Lindgomyces ingoldianus]KAF2471340.1 hypothetical protein BDR25DRAFT_26002 [Lindgomyces ingoldianus]
MVVRQEGESAKLYFGNLLFYDYLRYKRHPVFLNRNLRRALELHDKEVETSQNQTHPNIPPAGYEHIDRLFWTMPSTEMMRKEEAKKALVIEVRGMVPENAKGVVDPTKSSPSKKKVPLFRTETQLMYSIWSPKSSSFRKTFQDFSATIVGTQTNRGTKIVVNTSKEIRIGLDDLLVLSPGDSWRKGMADRYGLQISINFSSSVHVDELFSHLDIKDSSLREDPPTRLIAKWDNVLNCPEEEQLLPLFYRDSERSELRKLGVGVKVYMRWKTPTGVSTLATANQRLKTSLRSKQRQVVGQARYIPPETSPVRQKLAITYVFAKETLKLYGPVCPHCHRKDFQTFEDLRMHFDSYHDFFRYRVKMEKETASTQHWRLECDVANHKANTRASDRAPDPRGILVVKPKRAFNKKKYLNEGNKDFQKEARLQKTKAWSSKTVVPVPLHERRKKPEDVPVKPKTARKKFLYKVPKAPPGITLFRTITKRPLVEGEWVDESDDDPDVTWLDMKKETVILNDPNIPEQTKRVLIAFDRHMREEQLQGEIHVGDALMRFTRLNLKWLIQENLDPIFIDKVDELSSDGLISGDIYQALIGIIQFFTRERLRKSSPHSDSIYRKPSQMLINGFEDMIASVEGSNLEETKSQRDKEQGLSTNNIRESVAVKGKRKGRAKATRSAVQGADSDGDIEMGDADTPVSPSTKRSETPPIPYDECLCGEGAFCSYNTTKPIIWCNNPDCVRHAFHIECVTGRWAPKEKLDPKRTDWFCQDCELDPDVDTGSVSGFTEAKGE